MNKLFSSFLFIFLGLDAWAGKIMADSIHGSVLDSAMTYSVYLPTGYELSSQKYPVVYLLCGPYGTCKDWASKTNMEEVADELIEPQEAVPMVIIVPNAGNPDVRNQWNGCFNMPDWNYGTFFFAELLPTIEKKYRAIGDKAHRAIMGLSTGGGGSTVHCQRHPDLFSPCYAMSAWLDDKEPEVAPHGKDKLYYVSKSTRDYSAINFITNTDETTKQRLHSVRWFFDCGDGDYLVELPFKIHQLYAKTGIKNELHIRNGVHNWEYWYGCLHTALSFASIDFRR